MSEIHDAAKRAAEKIFHSSTGWDKIIHDAIEDHLKSEGYDDEAASRCACEFADGKCISACGYHQMEFNNRLKSEGWVELREAAEIVRDQIVNEGRAEHDVNLYLDRVLRRVRGESDG